VYFGSQQQSQKLHRWSCDVNIAVFDDFKHLFHERGSARKKKEVSKTPCLANEISREN
jgi:hypothetical protein